MSGNIPVWGTIVEAWEKTYGVKGSFWTAFGIMFAIAIGLGILEGILTPLAGLISLLSSLAAFLLRAGTIYMGIMRARNTVVNYQQVFRAINWDMGWKVVVVYILQVLALFPSIAIMILSVVVMPSQHLLGFLIGLIGVISLIYITIRLAFGMCYVVDVSTAPVQALKQSYAATRSHAWSLMGIFALFFILFAISIIPFGIGLVWTLPCSFVLYGITYQKLNG